MTKVTTALMIVQFIAILVVPQPGVAFHSDWWVATGTAKSPDTGLVYDAVVRWSGRAVENVGVIEVRFFRDGAELHRNTLLVLEFWGNGADNGRTLASSPECASLEEVSPYQQGSVAPGEWSLNGIMRNCLTTGVNDDVFTASYLRGLFFLCLWSNGPVGVTHG